MSIPLYGSEETLDGIRTMFPYAFDTAARGVPRLTVHPVDEAFEHVTKWLKAHALQEPGPRL